MCAASLPAARRDGGYAWLVLLAGFMLNVFTAGNFAILGIFLVEFMQYFQVSKVSITWVGALQMCVGNLAGLGLGPLIQRWGPRVVAMSGGTLITVGFLVAGLWPQLPVIYIFYGACASVGFLAVHIAGMVAVQQYFVVRRALANGLFMTGFSIGTFVLPPLLRLLIDSYGWQGAMVVMAGVMMHSVFFGAMLRPITTPEQSQLSNPVPTLAASRQARPWRTYAPFLLFLLGFFGMQMGHMAVYIYTPIRCHAIGVSKQHASFLLSLMGLSGLVSRPVFGWVGDRRWTNKTLMFGGTGVLVGLLTIVTTQLESFTRLAVTATCFGALNAGYIAVQGAVLVDTVGIGHIEVATGVFMADIGLANFLLHISSGYLLERTGDADAPFLVFGGSQVLGGILVLAVPLLRRRMHRAADHSELQLEMQSRSQDTPGRTDIQTFRDATGDPVHIAPSSAKHEEYISFLDQHEAKTDSGNTYKCDMPS